jgi:hypothetical protein
VYLKKKKKMRRKKVQSMAHDENIWKRLALKKNKIIFSFL